jgi:large subunit ribosomal protein L13
MKTLTKTYSQKPAEATTKWYLIDASGQTLGRLSTKIATMLSGKHKPTYTPHVVGGDAVVVINAAKIRVTGNKLADKMYYRHSGYPGGIKAINLEDQLAKHPERVIEHAVAGMLPKNKLQAVMLKNLKVFAGPDHTHEGQKPEKLEV